jgi:RNA polymerase sigma-70 factor (ECF subfamily)
MEHLLEPCKSGERKAQKELYQQMAPVLYGICKRYLTRDEEAEEALSNSFLKVFNKLHTYEGVGSFEGWMKRITVRECLDYLRKSRAPFDLDWDGDVPAPEGNNHGTDHLMTLIQQLPVGYRTVFNLYAIEGFTHPEISEMLQISVGTSKSQLSKARAHLQQQLNKE